MKPAPAAVTAHTRPIFRNAWQRHERLKETREVMEEAIAKNFGYNQDTPDGRGATSQERASREPEPMEELTEPSAFVSLYRQAFARYGTQALWNRRSLEDPTPQDALVIARALRIEGDLDARQLAERIEQACRASL